MTPPEPECDHGESEDYQQDGPEPWINPNGECVDCGQQVIICGNTINRDGTEYTCELAPTNHWEHKFEWTDWDFSITVKWRDEGDDNE